jgi:hypothetical protein
MPDVSTTERERGEPQHPYAPNPLRDYICPYCNKTAKLRNADVVVDAYKNVCHLDCLDKVRRA